MPALSTKMGVIRACTRVHHPSDGGGDDMENLAASPPLLVWFDMEALGAHESDNLDVVATTEQHSKTAFRSDVQIEPPEEVQDNSESITGARHSEG